ncbi:MAG: S41 family peptidase [Rikenellaceae bacterium]
MQLSRNIIVLLISLLCWGCTKVSEVDGGISASSSSGSVEGVTEWMDDLLSDYYLYNDEYNTLSRDLTLSYDTFLGTTLGSMTTNVLDNKNGSVFTWIERSASSKATTKISTTKVLELSYGLASVSAVAYGSSQYILGVNAVIVDSPLYNAGVRRGDYIVSVEGATFTSSSVSGYMQLLLNPTSEATLSLGVLSSNRVKTISVSSQYIYCSPILHYDIYNETVGYLSYLNFDMAYDDELLEVLAYFKSKGVTDLILDMRLNTGGHTISANKLSTSIIGSDSYGRVFANYQYNPTLSAKLSSSSKVDYFYTTLSSYYLNLDRLYCLVSGKTASASEMVINSLRGLDKEVVLIGAQTVGKNVAMAIYEDSFDGWDYTFYPVMMVVSNAKGFSGYDEGFAPDYEVDDWDSSWNYADFSQSEVMVKTALNLISPSSKAGEAVGESTNAMVNPLQSYLQSQSPESMADNLVLTQEYELSTPRSQRGGNITPLEF